jgi:hypothetical protein
MVTADDDAARLSLNVDDTPPIVGGDVGGVFSRVDPPEG